eukprot:CAMPEP_0171484338 /NCGR_PEP_ID=MMETSP0946-20130122/8753_1 /TAXON_ID=109269 /ORGANISM="Vaucheria litorea, Strain CCMP2940" /LENGTH=216 /DNA_ID=CAMNT_0012017025 /DNA_START=128 /DNA_END=775 /DNA_ORIENTATION=+
MDIPLNTPIYLKAHTGNNLQYNSESGRAHCKNQNTKAWEQMVLIQTADKKIIIQSRWNGRNLQVKESGLCVFANHNQELWEKFDVESDKDGNIYFISCHTGNVMQCDWNGYAQCLNENRLAWKAWEIIDPETAETWTSAKKVILYAATGAVLFPVMGLAAGAMVPAAMSNFGTVVPGVGTFHAPLSSFGCAATLQASSARLKSISGAAAGAAAGAT